MREILFRGKTFDNEWVEGYFVSQFGANEIYCLDTSDYLSRHVNPDTVGEWTGLTDKNGKKIFIDDIVEAKQSSFIQRGVVTQLSDGLYVFKGWRYHDLTDFKLKDVNLERCLSVIGNIHDNPELLEVTK